jgi:transposase-like protein
MIEYTSQQRNKNFLDVDEKEMKEQKMETIIESFLREKNIELQGLRKDKDLRNELIQVLKDRTDNSVRKIAEALGVNRNTVQRIIKK